MLRSLYTLELLAASLFFCQKKAPVGQGGGRDKMLRCGTAEAAQLAVCALRTALYVRDCKKLDEQSFDGQPQPSPQLACRLHLLVQLPRLLRVNAHDW
jgi:hypothetical protein